MLRKWIRDNPPVWDDDRARILGAVPGIFPFTAMKLGDHLPGQWWHVEHDGRTVGFGWMETTWGDGEILLAVDPADQRHGLGSWLLEQLEHEARVAGLNYMHNVVAPGHPDPAGITAWLVRRGFSDAGDGRLRRRVRSDI